MLDFAKEAIENSKQYGINFDELKAGKANIKVLGVGGAGCNAITWLFNKGIDGARVYALNTDALHLSVTKADEKILIGKELTRGLGCGGYPQQGALAAKESIADIKKALQGADMAWIVAGMGGGTGTGAAPIVAQAAKDMGAITIGVVTMPFETEKARIDKAEFGLQQLREYCDTAIVIDNNRLVEVAGNLPIEQAFAVANELISAMIKGIVETITVPSLINLDFADVSAIMRNGDVAIIGVGQSDSSEHRVEESVKQALAHPLLDVDYKGATGALIHVTCGEDMKLEELNNVGELITQHLNPDANVIIGARINKGFKGVRVITILTGVRSPYILGKPKQVENVSELQSEVSEDLGIRIFK